LEGAEHDREVALNDEITRLRKLEEIGSKYQRKADIMDTWLKATEKLVEVNAPENLAAIEGIK